MPMLGAIYRFHPDTGAFTPFCTGLGTPFYGVWADDGFLYMPDRSLGVVWRISEAGVVKPFAAGGWLTGVVTVLVAPDGSLVASDVFQESLVRLGPDGSQTLLADATSSGGLLSGPGGMAFGPDGTLYVANNVSETIAAVDYATGAVSLVSDGQGLLQSPGGIAVDGAGNLFAANYGTAGLITRIRLATGEASVFCENPTLISPNDLRLQPDGGLRVTTANHVLGVISATGQLTVLSDAGGMGDWDGNVSRSDRPACSGRYLPYGTGLAGSGGIVPELGGLFSPCPGAAVALEMRGVLGGAQGALVWGLQPAALPFKGGQLLVNIGPPGGLIPFVFPGVGPGAGKLVLPFTFPDDAALSGVSIWLQLLVSDPGAVKGVAQSNGLQEQIGS
jgi:sugar lactone lactonase YvrE